VEYKNGKWVVTDKASLKKSFSNRNNWFVRYAMKYNKDPEVGDTVEITMTPQGFNRIAVA
jgi:hypothetical protein